MITCKVLFSHTVDGVLFTCIGTTVPCLAFGQGKDVRSVMEKLLLRK